MPALPLDEAGKYVAAAYVVFVALILVYVAIMAAKLQRIDRELGELANLAEGKPTGTGVEGGVARARDGVPVEAEVPAATLEPAPAESERGSESEARTGAEHLGGVIHEDHSEGVRP
jgi:hypothetical protein